MKLRGGLSGCIRRYPYKTRLPLALAMLCVLARNVHTSPEPVTVAGRIQIAALSGVFFFGWNGRTYWFLWGVAVGVTLVEFARTHSLVAR